LFNKGDVTRSDPIAELSAEDRLDIMELFAKDAWAIDSGDPEGVLQYRAEDALLDHLW
jgi:hypothetical protein